MMPLNHLLTKCTGGYKLTKSQEKIIHLDDIKLFAKNERELETLIQTVRIYSQDICMEFGIENIYQANNERQERTHDGGKKTKKKLEHSGKRRMTPSNKGRRKNKFLPSSGRIDTAIWMHYLDASKTAGEKATRQLHKNAASNIEQVLEASPHKAPTIRPLASHHENYPS